MVSPRALLVLAVAGLAVVTAVVVLVGPRSTDGPLQPGAPSSLEFGLRSEQAGTWGTVLPSNLTQTEITIESIEVVGASRLVVLNILVSDPDVDGAIGSLDVFPPPGIRTYSPSGATLAPTGDSQPHLQALIGVRLQVGSSEGTIEGLRVNYAHDGQHFSVELPYALRIIQATSRT